MAKNTQEVEEEVQEEPTEEPQGVTLQDKLDKIAEEATEVAEEPTEEVEEAPPEPEEPAQEQPKSEPTVSLAMKTFAKQQGLPAELVDSATSDEQLGIWMEFAQQSKQTNEEPGLEPEPEYKLELPEEEFPADDPVRKNLEGMQQHYSEQIKKHQAYLEQMADFLVKMDREQKSQTENQFAKVQHTFDSQLDSYENEVLGQRDKLTDAGLKVRNMVYTHYQDLRDANPDTPDNELIDRALKEFGYEQKQAQRDAALQGDNHRRLGGRPSP